MSKVTLVVDFPDGQEPAVHAGMQVFGGRLLSVAWRDVITDADGLLEFVEEFIDAWDSGMAGDSYLLRLAEKAIAKAKGES